MLSHRSYPFKKDLKIVNYFDNFSDYNQSDDEMWQRSKQIKPTTTR